VCWWPGFLHIADCAEERAHHPRLFGLVAGLAGDMRFGATRRLNGGTRRARLGLGALHCRAAGAGAGRALTDLAGLVAGADARRAWRNRRLQDVLGHIRGRRTLSLEHIAAHVGKRRAGRDRGLQDVFGPINLRTRTTIGMIVMVAVAVAAAGVAGPPADLAGALGY